MSGGRLPTAMRTLVRRPVGLGNYVPEGACFQTEGEKTCSRLKQRLHSALFRTPWLLEVVDPQLP